MDTGNIGMDNASHDIAGGSIGVTAGNIEVNDGGIDANADGIDVIADGIDVIAGGIDVIGGGIDVNSGSIDANGGGIDVIGGSIDVNVWLFLATGRGKRVVLPQNRAKSRFSGRGIQRQAAKAPRLKVEPGQTLLGIAFPLILAFSPREKEQRRDVLAGGKPACESSHRHFTKRGNNFSLSRRERAGVRDDQPPKKQPAGKGGGADGHAAGVGRADIPAGAVYSVATGFFGNPCRVFGKIGQVAPRLGG